MPVGVNVGAATHPSYGTGVLLGAELSVLKIERQNKPPPLYFGVNIDTLHDFYTKSWRLSIGPEVAIWPGVGMDAAPVLEIGDSTGKRLGLRVRYFAAFPLLTPYAGCVQFISGEASTVIELGLLVKIPILLSERG
jgi:hypothetical protein